MASNSKKWAYDHKAAEGYETNGWRSIDYMLNESTGFSFSAPEFQILVKEWNRGKKNFFSAVYFCCYYCFL